MNIKDNFNTFVPSDSKGRDPLNLVRRVRSPFKKRIKVSMYQRNILRINRIKVFLFIINKHFMTHVDFNRNSSYVVDRFMTMFQSRGLGFTLAWFKLTRLAFTRYLSGNPLSNIDGLTLDSRGLPSWLSDKIPSDIDHHCARMWLTLLSIGRSFNTAPVLDTSSITAPLSYNSEYFSNWEIKWAAKELGIEWKDWKWTSFHRSTKSGPIGQALHSCLHELTLLPLSLMESLLSVGGKKLSCIVKSLLNDGVDGSPSNNFYKFYYETWPLQSSSSYVRKLSYFSDKEGKTRVIAIMDYWSQTVLKPLHDILNGFLRGIESDCTYNQDHFHSILSKKGPYYSLDLKAATDLMPVDFQARLLYRIVGKEKAKIWKDILVGYPFLADSTEVRYSVGQPMGAYSSWPMMALTHHLIVRLSARRAGLHRFKNYAILGDDIVIANHQVAAEYRKSLEALNMPISEQKTHVSEDTYEFAKRWVYKGLEVTPFSTSGLLETWKSYPLFSNFLETQIRNGWELRPLASAGLLLKDLMKSCGKAHQSARTAKLLQIFTLIKDIIFKRMTYDFTELRSLMSLPRNITETEFFDSVKAVLRNQGSSDEHKLLMSQFDFSETLFSKIKEWTHGKEFESEASVANTLREFGRVLHPIGHVFNQSSVKIAENMHDFEHGDWDTVLLLFEKNELLNNRFDKNIFSMRTSHSRVFNQSRLVKDLWSYFKEFLGLIPSTQKDVEVARKDELFSKIRKFIETLPHDGFDEEEDPEIDEFDC